MNKAKKIKDLKEGWQGVVALYELSEPMDKEKYVIASTNYVILSGVETYFFPSNASGEVVSWCELSASLKGVDSHEEAFYKAGYEIEDGVAA